MSTMDDTLATQIIREPSVRLVGRLTIDETELNGFLEDEGVDLITIHARLNGEKFCRKPRWETIGSIRHTFAVPILVNGGIFSVADAKSSLEQSGADGLMIGRAAYGQPWLPGRAARYLATGKDPGDPAPDDRAALIRGHFEAMLIHYGRELGLKNMRKHFGSYVTRLLGDRPLGKAWRRRLCESDDVEFVRTSLGELFLAHVGAAA